MTNDWQRATKQAIAGGEATVAVLGCGYVGLTLATELARSGLSVLGVEPEETRAQQLAAGNNPVPDVDIGSEELASLAKEGKLTFASALHEPASVYIVCVNTPLKDGTPDLRYVESAAESVAKVLEAGSLVILESTTYPGTTEELLGPTLEDVTGLRAGEDFALANSPERINPGDYKWRMRNTPKVVGGLTEACTELAATLYRRVCDEVVTVSSPRAAEITKLFENTYREVNIALANEMAIVCHDLDIDPWEVLRAASSKPFGFTPFRPGPGVGGHCVPIDPQYLAWRVRGKVGRQFRVLETASDVNQRMPAYVAQRAGEILNEHGKAVRGANVLLMGLAYKSGSGDVRESPSLRVGDRLAASGAQISYHDPYVSSAELGGTAMRSQPLDDEILRSSDLVIVLTDHPDIDYARVVEVAPCTYDTRGVTENLRPEAGRLHRA